MGMTHENEENLEVCSWSLPNLGTVSTATYGFHIHKDLYKVSSVSLRAQPKGLGSHQVF